MQNALAVWQSWCFVQLFICSSILAMAVNGNSTHVCQFPSAACCHAMLVTVFGYMLTCFRLYMRHSKLQECGRLGRLGRQATTQHAACKPLTSFRYCFVCMAAMLYMMSWSAAKKPEDQLFETMDATDLNKTLKDLMDGLSVKVFRTYNASITLDRLLWEPSDSEVIDAKKADYDRANKEVIPVPRCFTSRRCNVMLS